MASSKFTKKARASILFAIRRGLTLAQAAEVGGVTYEGMRVWIKRGKAELDRLEENSRRKLKASEAEYVAFYQEYSRALAESEASLANTLLKAGTQGVIWTESTVKTTKDGAGNVKRVEEIAYNRTNPPDWRAAARMLEARFPERWARALTLQGGDKERPLRLEHTYADLSDHELDNRIQQLLNELGPEEQGNPGGALGRAAAAPDSSDPGSIDNG